MIALTVFTAFAVAAALLNHPYAFAAGAFIGGQSVLLGIGAVALVCAVVLAMTQRWGDSLPVDQMPSVIAVVPALIRVRQRS